MKALAKYSYINAKVRAMLSRLLEPEFLANLAGLNNVTDILSALRSTPYKDTIRQINANSILPEELEKIFSQYDLSLFKKLLNNILSSREHEFIFVLLQKYEIDQLKLALRLWHKKIPFDGNLFFKENIGYKIRMEKIAQASSLEEIIIALHNSPYADALIKMRDKFKQTGKLFYLETALETDYYRRLVNASQNLINSDRYSLNKLIGIEIDIFSMELILRLAYYYGLAVGEILEFLPPGGIKVTPQAIRKSYHTNGMDTLAGSIPYFRYEGFKEILTKGFDSASFSLVESMLYEIKLQEIKKVLGGFPFTLGVVTAYILLKYGETRKLIEIIYRKFYNLK